MAETVDEVSGAPAGDGETEEEEGPAVAELLIRLGGEISVLAFCEAQLVAARNLPEVRRTARDIAGVLVTAVAFTTAFVFANVAAQHGLATVMSPWIAALALCVFWLALGSVLTFALMIRAGHLTGWRWWRVFGGGVDESLEDLERARAAAEQAVRDTLAQLAPALTIEMASASIAVAGNAAGDLVGEAGEEILETSEEVVEAIAEEVPGGSVVGQVWDVVLIPGRFGLKVATTVLRRGESQD